MPKTGKRDLIESVMMHLPVERKRGLGRDELEGLSIGALESLLDGLRLLVNGKPRVIMQHGKVRVSVGSGSEQRTGDRDE